jgi:hypothetical protein
LLWPLRPPAYEVENKGDERNAREERGNPQSLPYDMDRQRLLLRRFDRYLPANPAVNLQRTRWSPAPQGDTPQSGNKEDDVRDVPFSRLLAIEDPVYPARRYLREVRVLPERNPRSWDDRAVSTPD